MGVSPVAQWISRMPEPDQVAALLHIDLLAQRGADAVPPLVKNLDRKLFELRWQTSNKQHRIIYFAISGQRFVLLHGFIKKTRATPPRELALAKKRMEDYLRRLAP